MLKKLNNILSTLFGIGTSTLTLFSWSIQGIFPECIHGSGVELIVRLICLLNDLDDFEKKIS